MIYESLKQIENRIEGEEYTAGGVTFYMTVDKLDFDISDDAAVNDYFVSRCAISYDEINLIPVESKIDDMAKLCKEWHFSQSITDEIIEIISNCDGYYQMFKDYYYVVKGNISDIFRVIQYGDELILLELYICD